ncbi:Ig-like domain-containing protein [Flavimarina sp. Hel_I_48]|uniref:Ig-like domain-containing protein n=1 Tax=Flavimarina sp. Hel_I_48 TaxID=1392488 RepID=UPI000690EABE|nr:Ig-like domain-containing protein [Flavimarina sp. Hel_I_48]
MLKKISYFLASLFLLLLVVRCAKRGSPEGGPKDMDPPVFVSANPPNYSTNFDAEEIRINFNELIKLKELQKNLIISPPLNPPALITPLGGAAPYIRISIEDTLLPNTTYVFNFGNSVVDNNENNPFRFFKYVMSTGDYIDSLTVKGEIRDALQQQPDEFVTVMLYEIDSTYNDSIIYKSVPRYVTNTLDSTTSFELTNVRAGKYRLAALKDEASNYTFQPDKDKIAFYDQVIEVPKDTSYVLTLFMEDPPLKAGRPVQTKLQRVAFPIAGNRDSISISLMNEKPSGFESLVTFKEGQDSLRYWYRPELERDSLIFEVAAGASKLDTFYLRKRPLRPDSLAFNALSRGTIKIGDAFKIETTIPIVSIDSSKISVIKSDSLNVAFKTGLFKEESSFQVKFKTEESSNYQITFLPEALTDFFGTTNDTLYYETQTKVIADYGELKLTLQEAENYPYIVQIVTEKGEIIEERYAQEGKKVFNFGLVEPGSYYARLILDANANRKYDTGNYLKQMQPETIIYYPKLLDLRSGWSLNETFILSQAVDAIPVKEEVNPEDETNPYQPEN